MLKLQWPVAQCRDEQLLREVETLLPELPCNIILYIIPFEANLGSKFQGIVPILFLASANIPEKLIP